MKRNLYLALVIFCLSSCALGEQEANREENENPHHSALPDSESVIETELSAADQKKIAAARGKEASAISLENLNANLENLDGKVGLCYFWNKSNDKTLRILKALDQISDQIDAEKLSIFLINTGSSPNVGKINSVVRTAGIDAETFLLENQTILGEITGDSGDWTGRFPAYYVYQSGEKTGLWLEGDKDAAELYAMLQTFVF